LKTIFLIDNDGREAVKCAQTDSNQAEAICPARFFAPSGPANHRIDLAGKKKGRTMNPLTQSNNTTILPLLIALTLGCFALSPQARAVDPPPDGGYANQNTAEGDDALFSLTTGVSNTAIGFDALFNNTTGSFNTAIGSTALVSNTTGSLNTALGEEALVSNTTGTQNTAIGLATMFKNSAGQRNTAAGHNALSNYTTGSFNTAFGYQALLGGDNGIGTGSNNTAVGYWALIGNQGGSNNTATGYLAMFGSPDDFSDCSNNTANGASALYSNLTGSNNVASGISALYSNTIGSYNTANGDNALFSNTTGSNNIAIGSSAGLSLTTGGNNIDIGNAGVAGESGIIRIGTAGIQTATFVAGIRETPLVQGVAMAVGITADGQLGVKASSARFKEAIKPMEKASEAIFSLKPVVFRYKKELDPKALPQFGLVAEQVAKVDPDLVACDTEGKPFTVRYDEVNAMLLNEFLKEHRKVEEQSSQIANQDYKMQTLETTVTNQQTQIELLTTALKAQAAQIQKVSDQLRTQVVAPRVVADN